MNIYLSKFLSAFYPNPAETIWLVAFPAKKLPDGHPEKGHPGTKRQITWDRLSLEKGLQTDLVKINEKLGLYFVVNAGGTQKHEITRINAVFCEIDDIPMAEQHELYDACRLQPSIRVETQKSVHAYWLLKDEMSVAEFESVQSSLIDRWKTDPKIKNPNRVMRLPHFYHLSWDDGYIRTKVNIHTFNDHLRYTSGELMTEFPPVNKTNLKPTASEKGFNDQTWAGVMQELRYRIMNQSTYRVESNGEWATCKGVCHNGNNNTALTVNLRTGSVSCKADCTTDQILRAFDLNPPQSQKQTQSYAPQRPQFGQLYTAVKARQG